MAEATGAFITAGDAARAHPRRKTGAVGTYSYSLHARGCVNMHPPGVCAHMLPKDTSSMPTQQQS